STSNKNKQSFNRLTNKFETSKKDFENRYGDHIAILKIFRAYENMRVSTIDQTKLSEWAYKYFIKKDKLNNAYQTYNRIKNRYRYKIAQYNLGKPDNSILHTDIKYRILASLMFGLSLNV